MKKIDNLFSGKIIVHKKNVLIICGIILLIIISLLLFENKLFSLGLSDDRKFKNEYESLNDKLSEDGKKYLKVNISDDNRVKYSSIDEVLNILEEGNGVIYFGSADCLYCRSAVQVLIDTARETKLKELYYLDISEFWDIKKLDDNGNIVLVKEASDGYNKLLEKLGDDYLYDYIVSDNTGRRVDAKEKRLDVPLVVFVVNGNIVSYKIGTLFSQVDPYTSLDNSQVKGLSEIYKNGIEDVLKEIDSR